MSEIVCLLCKLDIINDKYDINENYTKYSKLMFRQFLERLFEHRILLTQLLCVCFNCSDLLNQLDLAEITYKNLRETVLNCIDYNYVPCKSNVYSQTDGVSETTEQVKIKNETAIKFETGLIITEVSSNEKNNLKIKNTYKCHICLKEFALKRDIVLHIKETHKAINKTKSENEPDVISIESQNVDENNINSNIKNTENKRNKKTNDKSKVGVLRPYQCLSCPKAFKTLSEHRSHLSAHSNLRPFICEVCGQSYKQKAALDIHVGMHNGVNPFTCAYCKKSFTQKGALQRHMPIHTGETPFQCHLCGKRFVHHTSFNIHKLTHSGQKDYKCGECSLAFHTQSHLKRHMRIHTGERKYICTLCDKRFAERYNLVSHQKLHEKDSPNSAYKRTHRCQACGESFKRKLKLDEHVAKEHSKDRTQNVVKVQQILPYNSKLKDVCLSETLYSAFPIGNN